MSSLEFCAAKSHHRQQRLDRREIHDPPSRPRPDSAAGSLDLTRTVETACHEPDPATGSSGWRPCAGLAAPA